MAQQGFDGVLFWPNYTLMFITSESERTTVRVGRNLRERVFRGERGGWWRGGRARWSKGEHRGAGGRGSPRERFLVESTIVFDNVLEI
ncbi:hypothetical protein Bca101_092497 [Brassica carinata]